MANISKALILMLVAGCGSVQAQEEATIPQADDWYKTEYAPLYADKPWDKAAEVTQYFDETIQIHDETTVSVNALQWITDAMQEWKIEGWIRSEIADIEVDELNATTVAFKTKWRDYYSGGNIAYSCGWYLADYGDGSWKFTDYGPITCSEHGL